MHKVDTIYSPMILVNDRQENLKKWEDVRLVQQIDLRMPRGILERVV
jgi:hypothetical protein